MEGAVCRALSRPGRAALPTEDERAFAAGVEPYRPALLVHCYRLLGNSTTPKT